MKIYNSYILLVAILLLLTTVVLVGIGQNSLDIYYTIYIMEALIVTELYVYLSTKARRGLNMVSILLFAGFSYVIYLQVVRVLA